MAAQTVPVIYPDASATTDSPIPADRQPAISKQTHPSTGANDEVPGARHADDHDSETADRALEEK